jgi:hypothetical protein
MDFLVWYIALGAFVIFGLFAETTTSVLRYYRPGVAFIASLILLVIWLPGIIYYAVFKE